MKLPESYEKRMRQLLGAEYPAYEQALEQGAGRWGRVNTLRCSRERLLGLCPAFTPVGEGDAFLIPEGFAPGKDLLHAAGCYYVQELSAQYPVGLFSMEPGLNVLDLCAAPGGKSTQLAAAMGKGGLLLCNEYVESRARVLLGNLERMGVSHALVTTMEPMALVEKTGQVFDRVLVDAPCAGEGMFRKEPQALSEWSENHVRSCAKRQRSILQAAERALKPGGELVYSTCSFSKEENEETVDWFLSMNPDFTLLHMRRLYPHRGEGEGQFAALLKRAGHRENTPCLPPEKPGKKSLPVIEDALLEGYREPLLLPDGRLLSLPELPFSLKGLKLLRAGLLLGELKKDRFIPAHALAMAADTSIENRLSLTEKEAVAYRQGLTLPVAEKGWQIACYEGFPLGWGKGAEGVLKNHLPKGLRL